MKLKMILSIIAVLLVGGGGTAYYLVNKQVDSIETQDEKVDEIVDTEYAIALPVEEEEEEESTQEETSESTSEDVGQDADKATSSTTNTETTSTTKTESSKTTQPKKKKTTVASITKKYEPSFADLEAQANAKVDSLVSHAFEEYITKKKNDEKISYFYFYAKYSSAGKELEAKTDASFNVIFNALVADLKKHGFSESHAEVYREQYEQQKSAREAALRKKAVAALK
ncbi:hypothetical protein LCL95_10140 [Bacillus timonensis]|nr:hypothetical protein [Bacillus timonensis]